MYLISWDRFKNGKTMTTSASFLSSKFNFYTFLVDTYMRFGLYCTAKTHNLLTPSSAHANVITEVSTRAKPISNWKK